MDSNYANLRMLEAAAMSRVERWSEKEQQGKELQRLAAEEKRLAMMELRIIRQTMAEKPETKAGGDEGGISPEGIIVEAAADSERQVGTGHDGPPWIFNRPYVKFLPPRKDPETDEPLYDVCVVRGQRSNRRRAYAAATVYGPELRESSLAAAIYATGETKAGDATSVRSSLGALVRYGDDWKRENGWLVYRHNDLEPDMELITKLVERRGSSGPEAHED